MEFYLRSGEKFLLDEEDALKYVGVPIIVSSNGYLRIVARNWNGDRYVHRDILKAKKHSNIDHINGNKLDNRKENLRFCTHQQNMCNTKLRADNNSGVKGVYWCNTRMKWNVQIAYKKKTIALGRFTSFEDAVAARLKAEQKYHGEFAKK